EVLPDGGYLVELQLDEPLPVRDAVPELAVDGKVVGVARESADGLTLTVETADPAVAEAETVEVAWNGVVPDAPVAQRRSPAASHTAPHGFPRKPLYTDPAQPGPYAVERLDYD